VKCPNCGTKIEIQQIRAGKARWSKIDKKDRSLAMKKVRAKGK